MFQTDKIKTRRKNITRNPHGGGNTRLLLVMLGYLCLIKGAVAAPQIPAMFAFGDSLIDDGNNNGLNSLAKSNYYPYGIDFYQGSTGRFCNGKTVVDALCMLDAPFLPLSLSCDLLELPYIPAYTTAGPNGTSRLGGVNYASAGGGILDETGQHLGERYSLNQQVLNFESDLNSIRAVLGTDRSYNQFLARSIAVMVFGSNDYINNYLLPSLYNSGYNYTPEQFANLLLNHYTRQILALNSVGLRKFLLAGVGPLGCIPSQRASGAARPDRCVDQVNEMVVFFNQGLRSLVEQLNSSHPGSIFIYGNTYAAVGDMLNNPANYGFSVLDRGCCGIEQNYEWQFTCLPLSTPCPNRNQYVFWDAFHPTESVNLILAQKAYTGNQTDVYPINVQQLAQL
ncbi:GDSL esterase/lipase [Rhynchospora pubera]|uniref:GDSL esterase/lipase n=1 Tax=Rhynchospora pubera TaxID=906938 RepID=A0AAV8H2Y6_9POAL|nr:GDSL esterase/lipase [Rhynchospora pubera]